MRRPIRTDEDDRTPEGHSGDGGGSNGGAHRLRNTKYDQTVDKIVDHTVRQPDEHRIDDHTHLIADSYDDSRTHNAEHRGPRHDTGHGRRDGRDDVPSVRTCADSPARLRCASDGATDDGSDGHHVHAPFQHPADNPESDHYDPVRAPPERRR